MLTPPDSQPPIDPNDPALLAQMQGQAPQVNSNAIDNLGPSPAEQAQSQPSGQPGDLQSAMSNYAGWLLHKAQGLQQYSGGAGNRFKQGIAAAAAHQAGIPSDYEAQLQNMGAQDQALRTAVGVQDSGLKQQQLDYSQKAVTLQRADGSFVTIPEALMKTIGPALIRGDASTANTKTRVAGAENVAGINAGSREKVAGINTGSRERIGAAHDATAMAIAKLRGMYSLRRASIAGSAGGGSDAGDYIDALREGLPITSVPPKLRGQALALAKSQGVNVAFQKLSPSAQRMQDAISELTPVLGDLRESLEPYKTQDSIGDKGHAAVEGLKYQMGFSTDDPLYQQFNKVGNLVTLLGTTPYTTIGRGKYLFDEAKKHLPRPGVDTPKLAYEKTQVLEELMGQMEEGLRGRQFNKPSGMGGPKKDDNVVKWGRDASGKPVRLP